MNNLPLISIVIPTHNRKKLVDRLIHSIYKSTYANIEIFVIDDASIDDTYLYLKEKYKRKNVFLIRNKISHYVSYCRNKGAKMAKGKYIFFVDDDNVLPRNLLQELVNIFEADKKIGEVGPMIYSYKNKQELLWMKTQRSMLTTKTNFPRDLQTIKNNQRWDTDDIPNAFMVKSKVVKGNAIYFNEKLFPIHYEESDYAYRIRKLGYKIVVASRAIIYHDVQEENGGAFRHYMEDPKRTYFNARNRLVFHGLYSDTYQKWIIILFWNWAFAFYYIFNIVFFTGSMKISWKQKKKLVFAYLQGCKDGLFVVVPSLFAYVN